MTDPTFRDARPDDAGGLLDIYRPIVERTPISFEVDCPSEQAMAQRIGNALENYAWVVAELDGRLAGYAYASPHRPRGAYRFSAETTVYVHPDFYRRGIGRRLYQHLFEALRPLDYYHAFAGITLPNDGSVGVHRSVGFSHVGTFPNVGFKFGRWHDVSWWYRELKDGTPEERA